MLAQISLNLSSHLSLSFIASSRSSRLHPVSYRAVVDKFLVDQLLHIRVKRFIGKRLL